MRSTWPTETLSRTTRDVAQGIPVATKPTSPKQYILSIHIDLNVSETEVELYVGNKEKTKRAPNDEGNI